MADMRIHMYRAHREPKHIQIHTYFHLQNNCQFPAFQRFSGSKLVLRAVTKLFQESQVFCKWEYFYHKHDEYYTKTQKRNQTWDLASALYVYFLMHYNIARSPFDHAPEIRCLHCTRIKPFAFELAAKDRERRENPVLSRLKIAFYALHKRNWAGFSPRLENFGGQLKRKQLYSLLCTVWILYIQIFLTTHLRSDACTVRVHLLSCTVWILCIQIFLITHLRFSSALAI